MDDHTSDPTVSAPSVPLTAPMAFDAKTKHHKVHAHVLEDSSDSSGSYMSLDVGNQFPKSCTSKVQKCRRRGRGSSSVKSGLSLPVRSISARCWYVPVLLHGMKLERMYLSSRMIGFYRSPTVSDLF